MNYRSGLAKMVEVVRIDPRSDLTIEVVWSDGREAHIDFAPIIDESVVFNPMRRPDFFVRNARIVNAGSAIAWSTMLEFSADGLRYEAFPDEYRRDFLMLAAE
jgi:hypothetical protein